MNDFRLLVAIPSLYNPANYGRYSVCFLSPGVSYPPVFTVHCTLPSGGNPYFCRFFGVDYAIGVKSYNPLLWMVARIVWYKIVHVGDFILSLLRLYLFFFVHLSTDSVIPGAKGVTSIFSRLTYFSLFIPLLLYEFT